MFRRERAVAKPTSLVPPGLPSITVSTFRAFATAGQATCHYRATPRRLRLSLPSSERRARPTDSPATATIGSATSATEPAPPLLGVRSSGGTLVAPIPEILTPRELAFRVSVERYSDADWAGETRAELACCVVIRYSLLLGVL